MLNGMSTSNLDEAGCLAFSLELNEIATHGKVIKRHGGRADEVVLGHMVPIPHFYFYWQIRLEMKVQSLPVGVHAALDGFSPYQNVARLL